MYCCRWRAGLCTLEIMWSIFKRIQNFKKQFVFLSICFKLPILWNVTIRTYFHFKTQNEIKTTNELMYGCSNLASCNGELKGHVIITALFLSYGMVNTKNYVFNFRKLVNEKRQANFIYFIWAVSSLLKLEKKS